MPKSNYTFLWTDYQPARTMEWNTLGIKKYPEIISNKVKNICYVSRDNMLSCYFSNDDLKFQEEEGKGFLDKKEYEKFVKGVEKNYKNQWAFNNNLKKIDYSKLSNDGLYDLFVEINNYTSHSICYFRATQHEPTIALLDKIRSKINDDEMSLLVSPTVADITNYELIDWEKLLKKKYSKDLLLKHVAKYPWLVISHFTTEDVIESFKQRYDYDKAHFEHKDIMKEKKELKCEQDKILKKHPEIKEYVLRAQRLALTRMEVKSAWASQDFYIIPLMMEISKRTGEDIKEIGKYYLIEEVEDLLDGKKLSKDEKERRRKCFVGLWRDGKLIFASGEEGEEIARKELGDLYETKKSDELTGNVANRGIVRGIARIHEVNNFEQTKELRRKFKKGDILISGMTQPNIMDIASKAAGLVTDEGGMLSHAAIISRELKIPCIVGTHFATQAFKDGDLVEVDADKGVVRKLHSEKILNMPDIKEISEIKWTKNWSGKFSMLAISACGESYMFSQLKFKDTSMYKSLYTYHKGISTCYLPTDIKQKCFDNIVKEVLKDENLLLKLADDLNRLTDEMRKEMSKPIKTFFDVKNYDNFYNLYLIYEPTQVLVKVVADYLPPGLLDRYGKKLEQARVYTEPIYDEVEAFYEKISKEISKKENYPMDLLMSMSSDELVVYLKEGKLPSKNDLEKRYNRSAMYYDHPNQYILVDNVDELEHKIAEKSGLKEGIVKGISAYPGKVSGRCKIILKQKDFSKFQQGDIIVATMTRPEYITLMSKATAVVTDAGGLLCHAAIVARELKIPCVVGTEVATKAFKDGDLVEVDADKGIVRKIDSKGTFLEDVRKIDWTYWINRHYRVLALELVLHSQNINDVNKFLDIDGGLDYYAIIRDEIFYSKKELDKVSKYLKDGYTEQGVKFFEKPYKKWISSMKNLENIGKVNAKKDFSKLSDEQLVQEIFGLKHGYFGLATSINVPLFMDPILEEDIKVRLSQKLKDKLKLKQYFDVLTTLVDDTAATKETKSILRIALQVKKNELSLDTKDKKFTQMIKDHIKKFGWLNVKGFYGDEWTIEEIMQRLRDLLRENPLQRLRELENNNQYIKAETERILNEIHADQEFRAIVKFSKDMVAFRTNRMDMFAEAGFLSRQLFREAGKRLGLGLHEVFMLTCEELSKSLINKVNYVDLIKERENSYGCIFMGANFTVIQGNDLKETKKIFVRDIPDVDIVQGNPVFKGKVTGRAKIVRNRDDLSRVEKGDVMIATMTYPHYITAMEKSIAFVTDEGGILCHAAIISREMKKPCVIGTKVATKVFHDGDIVEVDADKGVVRKVQSIKHEPYPKDLFSDLSFYATRPSIVQRDELASAIFVTSKGRTVSIPYKEGTRSLYVEAKRYEDFIKYLVKSVDSEKKWKDHLNGYDYTSKRLLEVSNEIKAIPVSQRDACVRLVKEWWKRYGEYTPYVFMPFALEKYIEPECKELLSMKYGKKSDEMFSIIGSPTQLNDYNFMRLDIFDAFKNHDKSALKGLVEKYQWYSEYSYVEPLLDEKYFEDEIKKLTQESISNEKKQIDTIKITNKKSWDDLRKKLKDKRLRLLADIINSYVLIRTQRMDILKKSQFCLRMFFSHLAEEISSVTKSRWDTRMVASLTTDEIIKFLEDSRLPNLDEIKNRISQRYVYYLDKNKAHLIYDEDTIKEISDLIHEKEKKDSEVKGTVAYKGKVSGVVRVIVTKKDLYKIAKGDILVAKTTMTDYTSAMHKAAAFVTDEGGVTSHTAVIAREQHKPAIVGTGNATVILADGDLVEVDADRGIVRKINNLKTSKQAVMKKKPAKKAKKFEVKKKPAKHKAAKKEKLDLYTDKDILWFKDLKKEDIPIVGGKGANLGEMYNHFPIPNGFCVTVHAYRKFMEMTGIIEHIHGLLDALDVEETEKLDETSKKVRDMILKQKFPAGLKKEIISNYKKLAHKKVAVRSSATAEDLPTASFAGQQDTYLNMTGDKKVIDAVQRCWASLFTSRAIYYREKNNFKHRDVLISVVVQEMIDADYAGVMFTIDPVNKKYILIEVVEGLGESLVSGMVTPNTYFVHKSDSKVMEQSLQFAYDEKVIHEVAKVGRLIEKHYKKPMDVEFAVKKGKIYILQARPITTL